MVSIKCNPQLWNQNVQRTSFAGSPHREASDIWLRYFDPKDAGDKNILDNLNAVPYPAWSLLAETQPLIFDLMRLVRGTRLGKCVITRLKPGSKIYPHKDEGTTAWYYDRYHINLHSMDGVKFRSGDETIYPMTGSCWLVNNQNEHEVINDSNDERIVMIVDIHS